MKDTWISSLALGNLARVRLCAADDPALARQLLAEALWLARERNDRRIAAEWIGTLAAARALEGRTADAARFCACAEVLRESTGAELYPAERMIRERFLDSIRTDSTFPAALEAAQGLSTDELIGLAVAAASERSAETVASPAIVR